MPKPKIKLKTKPFPHQLRAAKRAVKQGNHAFLFEPRLGKTKAVIDAAAIQCVRGRVRKVVVLAPKYVLDVWVEQIRLHCALTATVYVVGDEDDPVKINNKRSNPGYKISFYLVNNDKFSRSGHKETYRNDWVRAVEDWNPDLVVLDESHRFKRAGAIRAQSAWRMVKRLRAKRRDGQPFVYLMTGTPNPKGYIDLFAQWRILDEQYFGTNKEDFEDNHVVYGVGKRRWTIIRYRHVKAIKRKVESTATIVNAKQAGLQDRIFFNKLWIDLPPRVRRMYEELATNMCLELDSGEILDAKNQGVLRMRLLQLTGGYTTAGECLHKEKLASTLDFLADLCEQEESVVVYARYLPEVAALYTGAKRLPFHRVFRIQGGGRGHDRTMARTYFQKWGRRKPLAIVAQSEALQMGVELSASAEVHFYSLPDAWDSFWQNLLRVGGPNQDRPVRVSATLARGTMDPRVLEGLRRKRDWHRDLMKHPKEFLFDL